MTKKIKPVTPGLRFRIPPSFEEITTNVPEKSLLITLKKSGGRNSSGKMTVRNICGGHKKKIRLVDFKRTKDDIEAIVKTVIKDIGYNNSKLGLDYKNITGFFLCILYHISLKLGIINSDREKVDLLVKVVYPSRHIEQNYA